MKAKVRAQSVVILCRGLGLGSNSRGGRMGMVRVLPPLTMIADEMTCVEVLSDKPSAGREATLHTSHFLWRCYITAIRKGGYRLTRPGFGRWGRLAAVEIDTLMEG